MYHYAYTIIYVIQNFEVISKDLKYLKNILHILQKNMYCIHINFFEIFLIQKNFYILFNIES